MPDDPMQILRKAGIECPEVEAYAAARTYGDCDYYLDGYVDRSTSDRAILALAKLAAKYKWQRDNEPPDVLIPSLWSRIFGHRDA